MFLILFAGQLASLPGQCTNAWQPGSGYGNVEGGSVFATVLRDPDGAGPLPTQIVLGGDFTSAGGLSAPGIAALDPSTNVWSSFSSGPGGTVLALAAKSNGDLVALHGTGRVSRHTGTNWVDIGGGVTTVQALLAMPNGNVVVTGQFTTIGGVPANRIARWDGTTWHPFGLGLPIVAQTMTLKNGLVVVGLYGSASTPCLVQWNGAWQAYPPIPFTNPTSTVVVQHAVTLPNGDIVVILEEGGPGIYHVHVARWDGTTWTQLPINGLVRRLGFMPNGDLLAALDGGGMMRWSGGGWIVLPSVFGTVNSFLNLPSGELMVGFTNTGFGLARWTGTSWQYTFTAAMTGIVLAIDRSADGTMVVGGTFPTVNGILVNHIARFDGTTWQALGSGVNGWVYAAKVLPNGHIVVGGSFSMAGGVATNRVAVWNGSTWSSLGSGITGSHVAAIEVLPNGDLVVGGSFGGAGGGPASNIARWNGAIWQPMGAGSTGSVVALAARSTGEVFASGAFGSAPNYDPVGRWDGVAFQPIGGLGWTFSPPGVLTMAIAANDDLLVGGSFSVPGYWGSGLARWNGSAWQGFAAGVMELVSGLLPLPNGDIVVVGDFTIGGNSATSFFPMHGIGILTASGWRTFEPGLAGSSGPEGRAVGLMPNGLLVGGAFTLAGGLPNAGYAMLTTSCPPMANDDGGGCTGAGGPNLLSAKSLPWLGSTFRSQATGLSTNSMAVSVYGFTPLALPMPTVHALGQPGCSLLVAADFLQFTLVTSGSARSELSIPATGTLVGGIFHHQVVPVEVDALGNLVALTATNRLTLTIGTF